MSSCLLFLVLMQMRLLFCLSPPITASRCSFTAGVAPSEEGAEERTFGIFQNGGIKEIMRMNLLHRVCLADTIIGHSLAMTVRSDHAADFALYNDKSS